MAEGDMRQVGRVLAPLLQSLEALIWIARRMHPPALAPIVRDTEAPFEALRAARAAADAWPEQLAPLGAQLDLASENVLAAFDGLREAVEAGPSVQRAYRALRHLPRALEALYPLAGLLPPVNRFFLTDEGRRDEALQQRLLGAAPSGTGVMAMGAEPDAREAVWVYVPETYAPDTALPLVMALHGGSGRGRSFLWSWVRDARSRGAIVVAPTSQGGTWALQGEDVDTSRLAEILETVCAHWAVDTKRLLLTGMSDGGTFAYVSGLQSGSPFTHLAPVSAAFHPMLVEFADGERLGELPIMITHGALDWMFPTDMARMAQHWLSSAGARVTYREITDLSHTYPAEVNGAILDWMASTAQE